MNYKKTVFATMALILACATVAALSKLLIGDFPSVPNMAIAYFLYALGLILALHFGIFWLRLELIERGGRGLHRNTPRYIDYCITFFVAAGLFQVYFSGNSLSKYVTKVSGTPQEILGNIQDAARMHLRDDCVPDSGFSVKLCEALGRSACGQKAGFTPEFCKRTADIINQSNIEEFVLQNLSKDSSYLDHPIGFAMHPGGASAIYSPIKTYVNQFMTIKDYSTVTMDADSRYAMDWLLLIILPIVIALRTLKTSIEIFGPPS